jgi:hypothetical protein
MNQAQEALDRFDADAAWKAYKPEASNPWDLIKVAHLYRRAGFGASWHTLRAGVKSTPANLVDQVIAGAAPEAERTFEAEVARLREGMVREDIAHHGQAKRVLTVTFSEFGRRVRENASIGTDHGAASQMFVVGESAMAGPIGSHPSLTDLDDGDLKFHTDFRSVYATLLDQWLKVPSGDILGNKFPALELFKRDSKS